MDDTEELKIALESTGQKYTQAQLQQLSRELDAVAEFLLDLYAHPHRRKSSEDGLPNLTETFRPVG